MAHKLQHLLWLERDLPVLAFDPSWIRVLVQDVLRGPRMIPAQLVWEAAHVALHRVWPVVKGGWSRLHRTRSQVGTRCAQRICSGR